MCEGMFIRQYGEWMEGTRAEVDLEAIFAVLIGNPEREAARIKKLVFEPVPEPDLGFGESASPFLLSLDGGLGELSTSAKKDSRRRHK